MALASEWCPPMATPIETIAIIGAGNGGCATAAQLAQRGFDIRLYGRSRATIEPLLAIGRIEYEGELGEGFAKLALVTGDAGTAVAGAHLVLITAPTHAHEDIARMLAPLLEPGQIVMAAPGHTLLLSPSTIRAAGGTLGLYCDSSSLPFICRKSAPQRVKITRAAQILYFAAFPGVAVEASVAAALGVAVEPLPRFFFRMGYTSAAGRDSGTAYGVFHNSEPNRRIRAPTSIDHRFFNEDVPYGLVAIAELGRAADVPTPAADAVIDISSIVAARAFRREGLTRERMGIGGMTPAEVTALLRGGWS